MTDVAAYYHVFKDEQPTVSILKSMDNQLNKFLDIYDKENPQYKKLDMYGKK